MSIQAVSWALEQDLPAGPKLVLVAIANHADHTNGYCWLRAETIGREASCTRRNVFRIIGALIRNGFIRKEVRKGKDGKQRASDYWILFERKASPWHYFTVSEEDMDPQDVEGPSDIMSPGENDDRVTPESPGPGDITGTDRVTIESPGKDEPSLEPSKPNKKDSGNRVLEEGLRAYRPPPEPQPLAKASSPDWSPGIFVIEGTPAFAAWARYRRSIGRPINSTYRGEGEHRGKTGRHFPSLFPPKSEPTGPPAPKVSGDGVDDAAAAEFANEARGKC